ncbi:hypothetical protein TWF281_004552 [Arthrobotrys megalospora]
MLHEESRMLFLPLLWRFREIFSDKTTIEFFMYTINDGMGLELGLGDLPIRPRTAVEEVAYYKLRQACSRMLEMTYLLTRGPWKYTLELSERIESQFPGIGREVLAKCEEEKSDETALQDMLNNLQFCQCTRDRLRQRAPQAAQRSTPVPRRIMCRRTTARSRR